MLSFYDPAKEFIENYACEYGIGCILLQDGHPVAYASRSLSGAERRYAQIEKEMLAAVYSLEKFHHYTDGLDVRVMTDHNLLVVISAKPLSKTPQKLQSLLLRAMNYKHKLGTNLGRRSQLLILSQ